MKLNHKGNKTIKYTNEIPSIVVSLQAYNKMNCYIDVCDKEVGWLGTAYKIGNQIRIDDVFLFEQEVHATTCELTPGGIADFVTNLYNTIDSDEAMEISNNLTCWGHSHVRMGVSPSAQDDTQLKSFSGSGHEWFVRIIGNKYGNYEYTYINYVTGVEVRDLDWRIDIPELNIDQLKLDIAEEVKDKVKAKEVSTPWAAYPSHSAISRGDWNNGYGHIAPLKTGLDNSGVLQSNSLLEDGFFDSYLRQNMEDEEDILANMAASANHETIMNIVGNDCDLISDTEYQILDEALCQLTLDDLAYIGSCKTRRQAAKYTRDVSDDFFTPAETDELYEICKTYVRNILDTGGIVNEYKETKSKKKSKKKEIDKQEKLDSSHISYISGMKLD